MKGQLAHYKEKEKEGAARNKHGSPAERALRIRHESEMKVLVSEVDALQTRTVQSEQRAKAAEEELRITRERAASAVAAHSKAEPARSGPAIEGGERGAGCADLLCGAS